jgi:hypothetical protein
MAVCTRRCIYLPIGKDEWEQGRTWETTEGKVLLFLTKNPDKAFSLSEIVSGIGKVSTVGGAWSFVADFFSLWVVQDALTTLIDEGRVKARVIERETGEETYYMAA